MDDEKDYIIVEEGCHKTKENLKVVLQPPIPIRNSRARDDWNQKVLGDVCNKKVNAYMCRRHQGCAMLMICSNLSTLAFQELHCKGGEKRASLVKLKYNEMA